MKTILFPTDFSTAATRAYIYALHLAKATNAKIILLHVYQKPDISGLMHIPRDLEELHANIDLEELENFRKQIPALDAIKEEGGFTATETLYVIEAGPTVKVIVDKAQNELVDYIVMGTTGATGLKEIFLGSIAGEVLENAPCPVLAVPEQAVFDGGINNIAFTISFQDEEKKALNKVLSLFETFSPVVQGVHVDLAHTENVKQQLNTWKSEFAVHEKVDFISLDGNDFQSTLFTFLENSTIDILVMVSHKRTFWQELFSFSKTKTISYHSQIPILSIPASLLN